MEQAAQEAPVCGLGRALEVIKGKWKPTLIWELHERPLRFGELKRRVAGITEKVLFEHLRQLEADGIVQRTVHDAQVVHVEYALTPEGAGLNAAVHALSEWGNRLRPPAPTDAPAGLPPGVVRVRDGRRLRPASRVPGR
ncbi:winged helix-turn-helix transcriptional regulator [Ideonella sp. BN130291]|uniref:winged helix-turn-helix transcriptional regulator n=1 Tax=Ideonella sp. BN130291 TaxID=3112940 RepID=UPI002E2705A9|nr:helix-turn-helix domain-containing protein [Ideonella sp. BN130291]